MQQNRAVPLRLQQYTRENRQQLQPVLRAAAAVTTVEVRENSQLLRTRIPTQLLINDTTKQHRASNMTQIIQQQQPLPVLSNEEGTQQQQQQRLLHQASITEHYGAR